MVELKNPFASQKTDKRFESYRKSKKSADTKMYLLILWEDYKKDFFAFLGWYLFPYKKS